MGDKDRSEPVSSDVDLQNEIDILSKKNTLLEEKVATAELEITQLRQSERLEFLKLVMENSLVEMAYLIPVRDDEIITDFKIRLINKKLQDATGRSDLIGKRYFEEFPSLIESGVFETMEQVILTGQSDNMEYACLFDERKVWLSGNFVKTDDGLLITTLDLTDRKIAEEQKLLSSAVQLHSEKTADIGSWIFDFITRKLSWSTGMYSLFEVDDIFISPEIYLEVSANESKDSAERLVNTILTGSGATNELIGIKAGGKVKMLQVNTQILYDDAGVPIYIIGVDRDVSTEVTLQIDKWELEVKQHNLEKKQAQLLYKASLNSQEDERMRIAETLHNGVGQLLFGIKLSLEQLNANTFKSSLQEFESVRQNTSQLLYQTIQEVRNLSHELSPAILEQFGLKLAIANVCNLYRKQIDISCFFKGSEALLEHYLQVTIYRTVQELTLNIFKHSGAKNASVKVYIEPPAVTILVEDDGIGRSGQKTVNGIGLTTIENKIALLNGSTQFNFCLDDKNVSKIIIPFIAA